MNINQLIDRDLKPQEISNTEINYQIQAEKGDDTVKLAFVKEKNDICVYEDKIDDLVFSLISYTLTDNDIINDEYRMIGFLIRNKSNFVLGSLDLIFYPNEKKKKREMKGKFKIVFTNNKNVKTILKVYNTFLGSDEIVYALTETISLLDDFLE
jgi:hypothetical protein